MLVVMSPGGGDPCWKKGVWICGDLPDGPATRKRGGKLQKGGRTSKPIPLKPRPDFETRSDEEFTDEECLTEELNPPVGTQTQELIQRRRHVRETMSTSSNRETIYVPVVFWNVHQSTEYDDSGKAIGDPLYSYCDYVDGVTLSNFQYTSGNNQDICNQRINRSIEVLNLDYAPAGVQFVLHPDYPEIQEASDYGYNCLCDTICSSGWANQVVCVEGEPIPGCCTSDKKVNQSVLYTHYNKPGALNIYLARELLRMSLLGLAGTGSIFGVQVKHGKSPGEMDTNPASARAYTLQHEIGHIFTLKHTYGGWYAMDHPQATIERYGMRGLVYGDTEVEAHDGSGELYKDCEINGDFICDTETEPGFNKPSNYPSSTFYIEGSSSGETCVYHGYGGSYDRVSGELKIGGYNHIGETGFFILF